EQADDLLALAGVGQDQGDVVGVQHAQVAVDGPGGVEDVAARAGGVERPGELQADVGRLAGAADGQPAAAGAGHGQQQLDGLKERRVEAVGDAVQRGGLGADDFAGVVELFVLAGGTVAGGPIVVDVQRHARLPAINNDVVSAADSDSRL